LDPDWRRDVRRRTLVFNSLRKNFAVVPQSVPFKPRGLMRTEVAVDAVDSPDRTRRDRRVKPRLLTSTRPLAGCRPFRLYCRSAAFSGVGLRV
jgi:hypothetical protein